MNQYKNEYESYYSRIKGKPSNGVNNQSKSVISPNYISDTSSYYKGNLKGKQNKHSLSQKIMKRVMIELGVTFLLFAIVLFCKILNTPETIEVYNYGKEVLDKDITLSDIENLSFNSINLSEINFESVQKKVEEVLQDIRSTTEISGKLSEETYNSYVSPLEGNVSDYNNDNVFIKVEKQSDVKSSSNGIVKEVRESEDIGKYILVDNQDGVEMIYGNLDDVIIKQGDKIEKGSIIGKTNMNEGIKSYGVYIKLLYMGNYKNPNEYINLNGSNDGE